MTGNHGGTISVQDMQTLISAIQDNNSAIASQALTFTQSMIDSKNKGDNYIKDLNLQDAFDSKKEHFATWQARLLTVLRAKTKSGIYGIQLEQGLCYSDCTAEQQVDYYARSEQLLSGLQQLMKDQHGYHLIKDIKVDRTISDALTGAELAWEQLSKLTPLTPVEEDQLDFCVQNVQQLTSWSFKRVLV